MVDTVIDSVRASRDGHQFHEAWVARCALRLLLPRNELCAIAVEGLSEEDEEGVSGATVEVADATFYFGNGTSLAASSRIEIAQFKYSIANQDRPLRMADTRETLVKFAAAEAEFTAKRGEAEVSAKLTYSLNTNRPLSDGLLKALCAASTGESPTSEDGKSQLDQLRAVVPLAGDELKSFASRISLVGRMEGLRDIERGNARTVADWSASDDVLARARLGDLRQLVRDKAGSAGQHNKVVTQVDVLAALNLAHESDLLPTPQAFPAVGQIVKRVQLAEFTNNLASAPRWIVHATAGVGKTVFLESLAAELSVQDEVVLFDCFGGGAYRVVTDGRHKPERGLLHIVNELACRGLCDPLLPGTSDAAEVVRRSLQRFRQVLKVIRRTKPGGRLFILIDAADNAALEAARRGQPSFPRELLESLSAQAPLDGLFIVVTARTERCDQAIGEAVCRPFPLTPFTPAESEAFILARRPEASAAEIQVVHRRAGGNPRVIANLIESDRDLVGESQSEVKIKVENLIRDRIDRAVKLAHQKGAHEDAISSFLCALSVLPPPVPIDEIAIAFGITSAEVDSFTADLSPLLDRTRHGLIFRDEPTETVVEQRYGSKLHLLSSVVVRLREAQTLSVYAARSLPGLLFAMGQVEGLRELAFDTRFPSAITSDAAKRTIRLNRLRMALAGAAHARNYEAIVDLLVELSSVVAVDERGEDYLLAHPDLVVGLGDSEALRRLFDSKTEWPGVRHARLATAYATDGDLPEALIQAKRADEWRRWLGRQTEQQRLDIHLHTEDFVGVAAYLVASSRTTAAARYLSLWDDAYSYGLALRLLHVCKISQALGKMPKLREVVETAIRCRNLPPAIIAAILTVFPALDGAGSTRLLRRLAKALQEHSPATDPFPEYGKSDCYNLGLQRCSMRAAHLGLYTEAVSIATFAAPQRFGLWALGDPFSIRYVVPWILFVAVRAATEGRAPTLFECLPTELLDLVSEEPSLDLDAEQQALLQKKLSEKPDRPRDAHKQRKPGISDEDRQRASHRLASDILPTVSLARQIAAMLRARSANERGASVALFLEGWKVALAAAEKGFYYRVETARYLEELYSNCALHALLALNMFTPSAGMALIEWMQRSKFALTSLCIDFVSHFAADQETGALAGRMGSEVLKAIEVEDDVQRRSDLMARLARALLPANRSEAASLFSRGMSELDAIGSGDQSFTNELLRFASSLESVPLRSETAHRLAKICELNVHDSHKFPWPLVAAAFSRVWGGSYLAQIARWHDRGKVELELTLPSAVSFLVRDQLIAPEEAIALLRLVDPVEFWDWGWNDLIETFIKIGSTDVGALLNELLDGFELAYPCRPPGWRVEDMRKVLERSPSAFALVKDRLERLEARSSQPRRVESKSRRQDFNELDPDGPGEIAEAGERQVGDAVDSTDPLNSTSIEALVAALDEIDRAMDMKLHAFKKLREKVAYRDQCHHIEAVVSARNLELFAKNEILKAMKADWLASSPSQLETLRKAGIGLVRKHAADLFRKEWGFTWELNELSKITGEVREDLAIELIEVAAARELDTAATAWLNLASILACRADRKASRGALERLLDSGVARLADEVGDGRWNPRLEAPADPTKLVAGLIWFSLGSPQASERWRAAHAVRTLARFGRWRVIGELFDRLDTNDAGAFQDPRLPFFVMYARKWFLLAVARLAIDFPGEIAHYASKLEAIAFNEAFPHVALREAARRALLACMVADTSKEANTLRERLDAIHVSKFPPVDLPTSTSWDFYGTRPKDVPEPDPPFYFDYDFRKYQIVGLGNMFGVSHWQVEAGCIVWIRKWDAKIERMHDFGGRDHPMGHRSYTTGDSFQSYGAYLARHALALEAGRLLLTTSLDNSCYTHERWDEWLSRYSPTRRDGLWLVDGTCRYPEFSLHNLMHESSEKVRPSDDPALLASLVGITQEGSIGEFLSVDSSWSSPDNVWVIVSSALVPVGQSNLAARALGTARPSEMWLPIFERYADEDEAERQLFADMAPVEPWISHTNAELKIDEHDPYASHNAVRHARPAKHIINTLGLRADEPWADGWRDRSGRSVVHALAWGRQGEHERSDFGSALKCERAFLSELLTKLDRDLILLVKLQHYQERRWSEATNDEPSDSFTYAHLVLVIDRDLGVTKVVPTQHDFALIGALGEHARYENRLWTLRDATGPSGAALQPAG